MAEHALDYALKACVWVKNDAGNYETIVPTNQPYFRKLGALAITQTQKHSPLLCYEPSADHWAHRVEVSGEYIAHTGHSPILLKFEETSLPQHSRNYTNSLLMLLNSGWEKEDSITRKEEPIYHATLPMGDMARGIYAFVRRALDQKPDYLTEWNGASICSPNEHRQEVDFHFGPELASGLFGNALEQLISWRQYLDPVLSAKKTDRPDDIAVDADFSGLRERLPPPPNSRVEKSEPKGKGVKGKAKANPSQIDFGF